MSQAEERKEVRCRTCGQLLFLYGMPVSGTWTTEKTTDTWVEVKCTRGKVGTNPGRCGTLTRVYLDMCQSVR